MIVAGLGFRASATTEALQTVLALAERPPMMLAVLQDKAQIPGFQAFAETCGLPVIGLREEDIAGEQTLTCSPRIRARFATGSVAEALAQVGARRFGTARLIAPRQIGPDGTTTLALAESSSI